MVKYVVGYRHMHFGLGSHDKGSVDRSLKRTPKLPVHMYKYSGVCCIVLLNVTPFEVGMTHVSLLELARKGTWEIRIYFVACVLWIYVIQLRTPPAFHFCAVVFELVVLGRLDGTSGLVRNDLEADYYQ